MYNTGGKCTAKGRLRNPVTLSEIPSLRVGWNFVPITSDMIGKKIGDLAVTCKPKGVFLFNNPGNQWTPVINKTINVNDLTKGVALYASNTCSLGGMEPIPMPDLPVLPDVEDVVVSA